MEHTECGPVMMQQDNATRKLLIFINPISGAGSKQGLRAMFHKLCEGRGIDIIFADTNKECDYSFLPEKIRGEGITDIVVCGGDGTVNNICAFLRGVDVNVGIIPMGSGNGLAFAAGIPKAPRAAIQRIINGRAEYIDAFNVNGEFAVMLAGLGFDAQVAHNFAAGKTRGLKTYLQLSLKEFFLAKTYRFKIASGEQAFEADAFFISIANSNQFGNGITIAPRASLSDGLLDIVIAKKTDRITFMLSLLRQIRFGKVQAAESDAGAVKYFQADAIRIENGSNAPFHIDGEPRQAPAVIDVRVIRNAIRLIR